MTDLDQVPTTELLLQAMMIAQRDSSRESDERWALVHALHSRTDASTLKACSDWCMSAEPLLRCLGADVLGQLGYEASYPFASESVPILMHLLHDPASEVVSCALVALGHLRAGNLDAICPLVSHESSEVRCSVAYCFGGRDEDCARQALITLSSDPDDDVRNWAIFGLGSLSEVDSPAIREALMARLSDSDFEIRGEAILGLAVRRAERVIPALLEELQREEVSNLAIEAAAEFPKAVFVPPLERLLRSNPNSADLELALERCRAKRTA